MFTDERSNATFVSACEESLPVCQCLDISSRSVLTLSNRVRGEVGTEVLQLDLSTKRALHLSRSKCLLLQPLRSCSLPKTD